MLYKSILYVPNIPEVKLLILNEIHKSPYFGHLGYQKMITMLRKEYFWPNMKNEVAKFLGKPYKIKIDDFPFPIWNW